MYMASNTVTVIIFVHFTDPAELLEFFNLNPFLFFLFVFVVVVVVVVPERL